MTITAASPVSAGFDPGALEQALDVVRGGAGPDPERDAYPGAVVAVARAGRLVVHEAVGFATLEPQPVRMRVGHIFDVASLTKVVVTTTAILQLLDRGVLCLDDRLADFFPAMAGREVGRATIRHLLTHTAGLSGSTQLYELDGRAGDVPGSLAGVALGGAPGEQVEYSCAGFILLGRLVEQLTGSGLAEYAEREILRPLGMTESGYLPLGRPIADGWLARLVPTERRDACERGLSLGRAVETVSGWPAEWLNDWRQRHFGGQRPLGIVHDENAAFLGGVAGNAGLFATASDLVRFGEMYLEGGRLDGYRVLSPAAVRLATVSGTAGLRENRGLGWQLPGPETSFGDYASPRCFGHTGFTGAGLWIDPECQLVAVLLTNRIQFGRGNERLFRLRRLFLNALIASAK